MSRKWFKGIKSIIVQRGEDYYLSGIVKNIRQDGDIYTAGIFGAEDPGCSKFLRMLILC